VDLYQLKYFLEAARELNFTRAADNLHISPSAVSRSVAQLEASVGKRLFARTKRRVTLSVAGESLKARAETIFDEVERAELDLAGEDRPPALLRIGSRELITNYLLPGPLDAFKARYGDTRFGIYALEPDALADAIKKDRLDFGFHYVDIPDAALASARLGRLRSHVYAAKKFKLTGALERPFVAPRPFGASPSAPSPDGYPDKKHPRKIRYEVEFLETHRKFVLAGLCVGVLPDLVMKDEVRRGEAVALPGPLIEREIYWFHRRDRVLPKAVEFLVAQVRAALRGLETGVSARRSR
jgi:DNA-binding transcriptional LysR family regulator